MLWSQQYAGQPTLGKVAPCLFSLGRCVKALKVPADLGLLKARVPGCFSREGCRVWSACICLGAPPHCLAPTHPPRSLPPFLLFSLLGKPRLASDLRGRGWVTPPHGNGLWWDPATRLWEGVSVLPTTHTRQPHPATTTSWCSVDTEGLNERAS